MYHHSMRDCGWLPWSRGNSSLCGAVAPPCVAASGVFPGVARPHVGPSPASSSSRRRRFGNWLSGRGFMALAMRWSSPLQRDSPVGLCRAAGAAAKVPGSIQHTRQRRSGVAWPEPIWRNVSCPALSSGTFPCGNPHPTTRQGTTVDAANDFDFPTLEAIRANRGRLGDRIVTTPVRLLQDPALEAKLLVPRRASGSRRSCSSAPAASSRVARCR